MRACVPSNLRITSRQERPISRKGAKHAKPAEERKNFRFAFLRGLATMRESS